MINTLVFITHDSILNSVFQGQVIEPLLKKIKQDNNLNIYLISFEKSNLTQEQISQNIPYNKNIKFIHYKRLPILSKACLYPSQLQLKKILKKLTNYEVIARGPISGLVALNAINDECLNFTVQARGLLAEEYKFSFKNDFFLKQLWHKFRYNQLKSIEQTAYHPKASPANFKIESVSNALSEYLIETYNANSTLIKIAYDDVPENIPESQKLLWREEVRDKLNIHNDTTVYCYSGAVKAWQCPDLILNFFSEQSKTNKNIFLLILTQDKKAFENMIIQSNIEMFKVLTVPHKEIYKYLCAADYGLIFRKTNHIINWVSRPVKAMEYQAAGLNIIHNNTVKWLIQK